MSTGESNEMEGEGRRGAHACLASLISCREYSKLSSKKIDTPLTISESIGYWFHKMLCMVCRRYERQIHLITHAAERYATRVAERHAVSLQEEDPAAEVSSKESLSSSAKARIQAKLEKALEK